MRVFPLSILCAPLTLVATCDFASADPRQRSRPAPNRDVPVRYMDFILPETDTPRVVGADTLGSYRMMLDRHTLKAMEIQDALHGEAR